MQRYNPKEIEPKWQKTWEEQGVYNVDLASKKPKFVGFGMFNYPSGVGIHVGHVRNFTIPDIITRFKRQQGFESYQPVGWDSFGLPAENFAMKTGVSPQESTKSAIAKYHDQYRAMGWAVDWTKEINTTDPEYYKWTQWCFVKLFENNLAYQKESPQWWCEHDKTVLADEQVEAGKCWRCGNPVVKKNLKQWFFKITEYADEILEATDGLDWTPSVKASQKAWIGRSVGAEIKFELDGHKEKIEVYTTRPDTLFGATFMVLAPEHPLVSKITTTEQKKPVDEYLAKALKKTEVQRQQEADKDKSGVFSGAYAVNPVNDKKIPIWIADYVLMGYGTGAIMAVPAHDERDWAFATKFDLPIIYVYDQEGSDSKSCYDGEGISKNSDSYDGKPTSEVRELIVKDLAKKGLAQEKVNYKMRDWLISRQRYWGAPIPIIHCPKDGPVAVPEDQLPVVLPKVKDYQPTGGNVSVLAGVDEWVNTECPICGGAAQRETDTMDGYVCSSWYFLRYLDPANGKQAWQPEQASKWLPIDFYNGADHATAHLLYARFFTRFFNKLGLIDSPEPFKKMVFNGKIKAHDGSAFSKSKGNGIDPLEVIEQGYGADAIRLYEMFAAPVELDVLWDAQGIPGAHRYLSRVWTLVHEYKDSKTAEAPQNLAEISDELKYLTHSTIKKVTEDIENMAFNTAIAALMEYVNGLYKLKEQAPFDALDLVWKEAIEVLVKLLAPFTPHIAEELWHILGNHDSVHTSPWPQWSDRYFEHRATTIAVQVNGKLRGTFDIVVDQFSEDEIKAQARNIPRVREFLKDKDIKKTIYVPGKLVNFVI